jgi:hypothetical protein
LKYEGSVATSLAHVSLSKHILLSHNKAFMCAMNNSKPSTTVFCVNSFARYEDCGILLNSSTWLSAQENCDSGGNNA